MKSTVAFTIAALTALGFASSASAATTGFYSGHFPLTVTQSQHFNGKHCLVLTDNGQVGFPHSGPAVLTTTQSGGSFQIVGHTLLVTIEEPGGTGQNAGTVLSAPASSGIFGVGVYDDVFGGTAFDVGKVVFGNKGGC